MNSPIIKPLCLKSDLRSQSGSAFLVMIVIIIILGATVQILSTHTAGMNDSIKRSRIMAARDSLLTRLSKSGSFAATLRASIGSNSNLTTCLNVNYGTSTPCQALDSNGQPIEYPVSLFNPMVSDAQGGSAPQITGPGPAGSGQGVLYDVWGNPCASTNTSLSIDCPFQASTTYIIKCAGGVASCSVNNATITVRLYLDSLNRSSQSLIGANNTWFPSMSSQSFILLPINGMDVFNPSPNSEVIDVVVNNPGNNGNQSWHSGSSWSGNHGNNGGSSSWGSSGNGNNAQNSSWNGGGNYANNSSNSSYSSSSGTYTHNSNNSGGNGNGNGNGNSSSGSYANNSSPGSNGGGSNGYNSGSSGSNGHQASYSSTVSGSSPATQQLLPPCTGSLCTTTF